MNDNKQIFTLAAVLSWARGKQQRFLILTEWLYVGVRYAYILPNTMSCACAEMLCNWLLAVHWYIPLSAACTSVIRSQPTAGSSSRPDGKLPPIWKFHKKSFVVVYFQKINICYNSENVQHIQVWMRNWYQSYIVTFSYYSSLKYFTNVWPMASQYSVSS